MTEGARIYLSCTVYIYLYILLIFPVTCQIGIQGEDPEMSYVKTGRVGLIWIGDQINENKPRKGTGMEWIMTVMTQQHLDKNITEHIGPQVIWPLSGPILHFAVLWVPREIHVSDNPSLSAMIIDGFQVTPVIKQSNWTSAIHR